MMYTSPASIREDLSVSSVSVVIPVYNASKSLPQLIQRLNESLGYLGIAFHIILVDDGSPDNSWELLLNLKQQHPGTLSIIRLAANQGQHAALLCGLERATGDAIITMDDDLQHRPEDIPKLLSGLDNKTELVIAAYNTKEHHYFRNMAGKYTDALLRRLYSLPEGFQLTSFRAFSRQLADRIRGMSPSYPYLTAMLLSQTSRCSNVNVQHDKRAFGTTNYNLRKSMLLFFNLLFNYSSYPLYFTAIFSLLALLISFGFGGYVFFTAFTEGTYRMGWASVIVIISFFSSLIFFSLTIFGIYISRINNLLLRGQGNIVAAESHD